MQAAHKQSPAKNNHMATQSCVTSSNQQQKTHTFLFRYPIRTKAKWCMICWPYRWRFFYVVYLKERVDVSYITLSGQGRWPPSGHAEYRWGRYDEIWAMIKQTIYILLGYSYICCVYALRRVRCCGLLKEVIVCINEDDVSAWTSYISDLWYRRDLIVLDEDSFINADLRCKVSVYGVCVISESPIKTIYNALNFCKSFNTISTHWKSFI